MIRTDDDDEDDEDDENDIYYTIIDLSFLFTQNKYYVDNHQHDATASK